MFLGPSLMLSGQERRREWIQMAEGPRPHGWSDKEPEDELKAPEGRHRTIQESISNAFSVLGIRTLKLIALICIFNNSYLGIGLHNTVKKNQIAIILKRHCDCNAIHNY